MGRTGRTMKYCTVRIQQSKGSWAVTFENLAGGRRAIAQGPHRLGFYHYPRSIGKRRAFERLRAKLVKCHETEIERLRESVERLRALGWPHYRRVGESRDGTLEKVMYR